MVLSKERIKQIVSQESPEVIAAVMADLIAHNEQMRTRIDAIEKERAARDQERFNLEEQVKLWRRRYFGKSSEKRPKDRPRDDSREEALLFSQAAFPSPENREGKNRLSGLQEIIKDHHPSEEQLREESEIRGLKDPSLDQWQETGFFDQCTKIQIIERSYVKEIHRKFKFKLKPEFNDDPAKDVFVTADVPELLPGMNYTTEFVASVIADKYISHMPLERQTREMESLGLKGMRTSTLSRMCALGAATFEPLQEKILHEDLIPREAALNIDETPWNIQKKDERDGQMWTISNRFGSYYFFEPTRSAKVLEEKLKAFRGPVVTDGLPTYNIITKFGHPHGMCWAHARRKFKELDDHDPTVKPILDRIDELFAIDREAKDFEELGRLRSERSAPIVRELQDLLLTEKPGARGESAKLRAINYALVRWLGLTLFLTDTRIPLSNNEAERTIRHAVVGRKNYYGSGTHSGAHTAATLFTIIESCKKNDIDPRTFLTMCLKRAAHGDELETPLAFARRTRSV